VFKAVDSKAEDSKAVNLRAELLSNVIESLLEWRWVGVRLIENRFFPKIG
jgi:hypothetical protein